MVASEHGHQGVVLTLLAGGAEINHQNNDGGTALSMAGTEIIKLLLRAAGATL